LASIKLENVTKRFGSVTAVRGMNLEIGAGEFFCVLGPPGAGKTTTLRLIVGLERPDEGTVYIDGEPANDVHPGKRDIAMMFQNLALYPDKSVFDNISYPLRERKMPKDEIRQRVSEVAKKLYIDHLLERKPAKLSGGERQRVALGRSLVRQPRAYLMDEPLANLDALLRLEMRVELKRIQQELQETLVYVTHDQVEAMSMADRIGVLNLGVLQQVDVPDVIYNYPANRFVAITVGSPPTNFMSVRVQDAMGRLELVHPGFVARCGGSEHGARAGITSLTGNGSGIWLGVRPEDVHLSTECTEDACFPAKVSVVEPLGAETIIDVIVGEDIIKAVVPPAQHLDEGQPVWVAFDSTRVHLFDPKNDARFYTSSADEPLLASAS
jgi:multiple sugar transport system ATP-binding protein